MKKAIFIGSVLILAVGGSIWAYQKFGKNAASGNDSSGNNKKMSSASIFIVDGSTYKLDKSKGYAKKAGDSGPTIIREFDADYWQGIDTAGNSILVKKTDVKLG